MAQATERMLDDMFTSGTGILQISNNIVRHIALSEFFFTPEPGERNPWPDRVFFPWEPYDDGGGAAIAAYRYGECALWRQPEQKRHKARKWERGV